MRQVVERVICDLNPEHVTYSDQHGLNVSTMTFTWLDKTYELDVCSACSQRVGTWTVHGLIEKARVLAKNGTAKSTGKRKPATAKHLTAEPSGQDYTKHAEDDVECSACHHRSPSMRGFKMHWTTRFNQERQLKAVV